MVTLSLLRHAKSSWSMPGLADFDRPLAPRGTEAAPRMGRFMADSAILPDLVVCSSAARTRQTLALVLTALPAKPEVSYSDRLYGASPRQMLELVRALPTSSAHAMLVAHNPAIQEFAVALCGEGEAGAIDRLHHKFPTAALAVVDFDLSWEEVAPDNGRLRLFMVPRDLSDR